MKYKFRTPDGDLTKVGLITAAAAGLGSQVWCILSMQGEDYRIHEAYLEPLYKETQ